MGWGPLEAEDEDEGWQSPEAGDEDEGVGWDPLEAGPLAGKTSWVLAGTPTGVCRELVAWELMTGGWQRTTLAGPLTEELAMDLAWDPAGTPTEVQGQVPSVPPTEGHWQVSTGPPTEGHWQVSAWVSAAPLAAQTR